MNNSLNLEPENLYAYVHEIALTDKLPKDDLRPVLMGLFGEVGSLMAPAKKLHREGKAYPSYLSAVEEEFGDVLWYLAAVTSRTGHSLPALFLKALGTVRQKAGELGHHAPIDPISPVFSIGTPGEIDDRLLALGTSAATLLELRHPSENTPRLLDQFTQTYLSALQASQVTFSNVLQKNIQKTRGRFLKPQVEDLPTFDDKYEEDERLPSNFEICMTQRKSGKCHMKWNGVFIGSPLTDNISDADGYRFHDVFHFANAAILHWSPTFRALIQHKRKSDPAIDENQDGGRAIVVEEGLTAWVFSRAKDIAFFEGQTSVSFDLLKTIQQFVKGYEVDACPLSLWEDAILQGYAVFRQVRAHNGGVIACDRQSRRITYRAH